MVNKAKSKKRSLKFNPNKSHQLDNSSKNMNTNQLNLFTEDLKFTLKEMAFASLSNKQFRKLGLMPEKTAPKNHDTIPIKFPSKLMPAFRKIFGFGKQMDKEKQDGSTSRVNSYITLISFQSFIHDGQQTKLSSQNLPTLQVTQIPQGKDTRKIGLTLKETNMKLENIPDLLYKTPLTNTDNEKCPLVKVTKKRSFFNDIWKKKPNSTSDNISPINEQKSEEHNQTRSVSPKDFNHNVCITCNKEAFLAERIQIGGDVFHNSCFKCFHCSKCLYRGKWNKHQSQYYCDYCYRRLMWPFVRR